MGAGASRGILDDPFPVDPALSKDLDQLSMVAARILSLPDIYDINNLARPGICGDYAVFLKQNIEKQLLGFVFQDISANGPAVNVLFQNPRRAISKPEVRQQICRQIAGTMMTVIATVVACLASIQVASPSRETTVASVIQRGGAVSVDAIVAWLTQRGYVSSTIPSVSDGENITLTIQYPSAAAAAAVRRWRRPAAGATPVIFTLTLKRATDQNTLSGTLAASGGAPPMPRGSLRVEFGTPIPIPGTAPADALLPIRVSDTAGSPWMAGALFGDAFISLSAAKRRTNLLETWTALFRTVQDQPIGAGALEDRAAVFEANEQFRRYRERNDPNVILAALRSYLPSYAAAMIPSYYSFDTATAAAAAGPPPTFDIPLAATKNILERFKQFRTALPKQSAPAAVRALTLSAKVNPDRSIQTSICHDPYWTETNLSKINPWATLQFLSVKDYTKMGAEDSSIFHPEWNGEGGFIQQLKALYSASADGVPSLTVPEGNGYLNRMSFGSINKIPLCRDDVATVRVGFREVQAGLLRLRSLYADHVKAVWDILNSLIIVVQDPETKSQMVRLHPAVLRGPSYAYVATRAAAARKLLASHYVAVESVYLQTVAALRPV